MPTPEGPWFFSAFLMEKALELLQLDDDKVELLLSQSNASLISVLELQLNDIAWFPAFTEIQSSYRQKKAIDMWQLLPLINLIFQRFCSNQDEEPDTSSHLAVLEKKRRIFPTKYDTHKACINNSCVFTLCLLCIINHCRFHCEASLIICILQRQHNWKANELHHWLCKWFAFWSYWDGGTE